MLDYVHIICKYMCICLYHNCWYYYYCKYLLGFSSKLGEEAEKYNREQEMKHGKDTGSTKQVSTRA